MSKLTFRRGIHPPDYKSQTATQSLQQAEVPQLLYYTLQQRNGVLLEPSVQVGDRVLLGQVIAESKAFASVPLHASVSGRVKDIALYLQADGQKVPTLVVENDGLDEACEPLHRMHPGEMDSQAIKDVIQKAGIVGMGGAGFPTHIKLSPPPDAKIEHIIINGAECEPYLTSDHRLMVEHPETVIRGLVTVLRLFPDAQGHIAIEENKPDAIETIREASKDLPIAVERLAKKYPQGSEKHLIYAVTGRVVPSGKLPSDVGCIVLNVDTAASICRAVYDKMPLYQRIVTVAGGAVNKPANYIVRIGTPLSALVEQSGGLKEDAGKILIGGPMMGIATHSFDVPVTKGTSAVLVLTEKEAHQPAESACIRCGRCVRACPMFLEPYALQSFAYRKDVENALSYHIMDCIECGSCAYSCPSKRHLVQAIRWMKQGVRAKQQAEKTRKG